MGNEVNLQPHEKNKQNQPKLAKIVENVAQKTEQENIEPIDEETPFSKFDVSFLYTRPKPSQFQWALTKPVDTILCKKMQFRKSSLTIKDHQNKLFKTWSSKLLKVNTEEHNEDHLLFSSKIEKQLTLLFDEKQSQVDVKILGENFIRIREESIKNHYTMKNKIGEGSFGSVYQATCNKTGNIRAIKILKEKIMSQKDKQTLSVQINLLRKLDHINIIKIYDAFYYKSFYYVVTEYCEGGSLLSCLRQKMIHTEEEVVNIMKQLISAVFYLHERKLVHRDLKLENIVLVNKATHDYRNVEIKLIDFGLSQEALDPINNESFEEVGTLSYMSPETINGSFSCRSDVWSCGIILCILLIGQNPFIKSNKAKTSHAIRHKQINFADSIWEKTSRKAKNLLNKMLCKNPALRFTSREVLDHEWINKSNLMSSDTFVTMPEKTALVIENIAKYSRGNNFVCFVKNFISSRKITQAQRQEMAEFYSKVDSDLSGVIEKKELIKLFENVTGLSNQNADKIMQKLDQNNSGQLDFQQFLIAMTNDEILHNQESLNEVFDHLDLDRTGYLSKNQILQCLSSSNEDQILSILSSLDGDGDGRISREEFCHFMLSLKFQ